MATKSKNGHQKSGISTQDLAVFIIDALIVPGIIKKQDVERAIAIVCEEIEVRKALGDYWCWICPNAKPN